MSTGRYRGLLVACREYARDSGLASLRGPANDARVLRAALTHDASGLFEPGAAAVLVDPDYAEMLGSIGDFFASANADDTLFLYFSGHAEKRRGSLYFCVRDTRVDRLSSTAIPARQIIEIVEESPATTKILMLDCCYAGAFKSSSAQGVELEMPVQGTFVLSSSRANETSRDGEISPFCAAVVQALSERHAGDEPVRFSQVVAHVERCLRAHGQRPVTRSDWALGDPVLVARPYPVPRWALEHIGDLSASPFAALVGRVLGAFMVLYLLVRGAQLTASLVKSERPLEFAFVLSIGIVDRVLRDVVPHLEPSLTAVETPDGVSLSFEAQGYPSLERISAALERLQGIATLAAEEDEARRAVVDALLFEDAQFIIAGLGELPGTMSKRRAAFMLGFCVALRWSLKEEAEATSDRLSAAAALVALEGRLATELGITDHRAPGIPKAVHIESSAVELQHVVGFAQQVLDERGPGAWVILSALAAGLLGAFRLLFGAPDDGAILEPSLLAKAGFPRLEGEDLEEQLWRVLERCARLLREDGIEIGSFVGAESPKPTPH